MAQKPRILNDGRDMFWSLVPLLGLCLLIAAISGSCAFGLTGGASDDRTPDFDVDTALRVDAQYMDFPVRQPATPEGWKPNSGSTQMIDGLRSSNVGWLATSGAYVQLTQTAAAEEGVVRHLGGSDAIGTGQREIGGAQWVTYESEDKRKFWITDLGDVRIAVLSRGPDSDIETIAESTVTTDPLPKAVG